MTGPRVCVDRDLHPDARAGAALHAVALRPDNLRPALAALAAASALAPPADPVAGLVAFPAGIIPSRLVGVVGKYWPAGHVVKVRFVDGSPRLQARVAAAIEEGPLGTGGWPQFANIRFDWSNAAAADVRVSFLHDPGSWSYIGTDCLSIDRSRPTMNLGWITDQSPDSDLYTPLHEFGHALGFGHEHESPVEGIRWDVERAIAWYQQTQGWSRDQVIQQVFNKYAESQTNHGPWDPDSIMEYPVDPSLTTDGRGIDWNTRLSPEDERFVATIYPRRDAPAPAPPAPPAPPPPSGPADPDLLVAWELWEEHLVRRAIANVARRRAGLVELPDLKLDGRLYAVAARFAAELASRGVLTHTRASGVPFYQEIGAALGAAPAASAENAAEGQPDAAQVVADWMTSEGHRANILGPYNAFAGAVATAADGTRFWVCDFASVPRP